MNDLSARLLAQGLELNRRFTRAAANGVDWVFKRDTLIKSGRTWFELVHDSDLMAVRYYALPDDDEIDLPDGTQMPIRRRRHAVPLVLVPPLGVTTDVFDLMPQRSLVKYLVASGFKVYVVDWGRPKKEHGHLGLQDYACDMLGNALKSAGTCGQPRAVAHGLVHGRPVLSALPGESKDPLVRNIVTVASPIDLESGSGVIAGVAGVAHALDGLARLVSRYSDLFLDALDPALLSAPPWLTTLVFKMTDPLASVTTYWDLMAKLYDREFLEAHSTTSDYLNHMLMYPGGVLRDMAVKVVGGNQLARGCVEFGDTAADLDAIRCNFLGFAGEGDKLVPGEVARCIVDIVASRDKDFRMAPGGHMGVIIGRSACDAVWAQTVEWLASRSAAARKRVRR
ncbi:MAG: alpha/beta hydrolase [Halioglobus sp.]